TLITADDVPPVRWLAVEGVSLTGDGRVPGRRRRERAACRGEPVAGYLVWGQVIELARRRIERMQPQRRIDAHVGEEARDARRRHLGIGKRLVRAHHVAAGRVELVQADRGLLAYPALGAAGQK